MELKICIIIIGILILIMARKLILRLLNILRENYKNILSKVYNLIKKFFSKTVEIFWIIILGLVILIPLFSYYIIKQVYNISYDEYKELLEIILNSNYVIVIGIIIIVYLFRNQLKKKIGQIKEVNTNGVKFGTQLEKNLEKSKPEEEVCDIIPEENEEIYEEIKGKISENEKISNSEKTSENIIYELEEQLKTKDKIIKKNQFINIKEHIAKTTNIILVYIYGKYKTINLFKQEELEQVLRDTLESENIKINFNLEIRAIIQFLAANMIIDTEDDRNYCITDYGVEFLNFLFEGRC